MHEKKLKDIKEPRWKKSNPKAKVTKIEAKSQGHKNWTIRFLILEYPVFLKHI
jgi:hypothetical protein